MAKKSILAPEVHVHRHQDKKYEIHVKLPGVKKENIKLNFTKNGFCVEGSRREAVFNGCHTLEHPVNLNKIRTNYYDVGGTLEITAPISKPIKCKKVTIK